MLVLSWSQGQSVQVSHLLLVLALSDEARLDAVARLQEGAALRQLARVMCHDAGHVARDQRRHGAVDLLRTDIQVSCCVGAQW